jgi:hypothetical protein
VYLKLYFGMNKIKPLRVSTSNRLPTILSSISVFIIAHPTSSFSFIELAEQKSYFIYVPLLVFLSSCRIILSHTLILQPNSLKFHENGHTYSLQVPKTKNTLTNLFLTCLLIVHRKPLLRTQCSTSTSKRPRVDR